MAEPDLADVAIFVSVAEHQSFSGAASQLRLPKSTVSRRVAQLEGALGVQLIHRTTRRLHLTEAGSLYFPRAQAAVRQLQAANEDVAQHQGVPQGRVRFTAPTDIVSTGLAELLVEFQSFYPQVTLDVLLTGEKVDLVGEGVDLALRAGTLRDSSLVAVRVWEDSIKLYASPRYLQERGTPRRLEDLVRHECVIFKGRRRWTLQCRGASRSVTVTGKLLANDLPFVRRALLSGAGVGLLPSLLAEPDVAQGALVNVLPTHEQPSAAVHLVYPPNPRLPARTRALLDFLTKRMRAREWRK